MVKVISMDEKEYSRFGKTENIKVIFIWSDGIMTDTYGSVLHLNSWGEIVYMCVPFQGMRVIRGITVISRSMNGSGLVWNASDYSRPVLPLFHSRDGKDYVFTHTDTPLKHPPFLPIFDVRRVEYAITFHEGRLYVFFDGDWYPIQ